MNAKESESMKGKKMKRASLRTILMIVLYISIFIGTKSTTAARRIVVPDDVGNLRSAICRADPGDEIFLRAGIYYKDYVVHERVTICGEKTSDGKLLAVLDGAFKYTVLKVVEDECILKDLIIQNSAPHADHAGIYLLSNENIVENCVIRNCYYGINFEHSKENTIARNTLYNNLYADMFLGTTSDSNQIDSNEFQCGPRGVRMEECERNVIRENLFSTTDGIRLIRCKETDISLNEIVCDNINVYDDTGENNWKCNGYGDYEAYSGFHPIPGGGHARDHEAYIALSRNHSEYYIEPDIIVPDHCRTIQEAVDEGDNNLIYVRAGVYEECNIEVLTSNNTIVGEVGADGQLLTVLNAKRSGCGLKLWKPENTVANLIIENTSNGFPDNAGIWIHSDSKNNTIVNCVFRQVRNAIKFDPGDNNSKAEIYNNMIYDFSYAGIVINNGSGYHVANNQFHMNSKIDSAIELRHNVKDSVIEMNMISAGDGIDMNNSDDNTIKNNEFTCDLTNAVDRTGLNCWEHNGYSDFDYPFHVYEIHPGLTTDDRAHLAHSVMY